MRTPRDTPQTHGGEAWRARIGVVPQSWRHLATVGVLGGWAVIGLVAAPFVLKVMARREAGSSVAARREKAMLRVG